MHVRSTASTLVGAALALGAVTAADNIDSGFTMDGVATYCQGLGGPNTGTFPNLEAGSLNRCPILVNITPGATTVHKNEALEVKFKAQAKFGEIPGNIFPRAILDQAAKRVADVSSAYMKWCKADTNCATPMDATPFGSEADTGAFDATGAKTFRSYRFTFTDPGEYVIFGQVTLPGDPQLNVSGQQFIAFQKINVVDTDVSIAPSPSPTPSMPASTAPTPSSATPSPSANSSTTSGIGFDSINNGTPGAGSVASDAAGAVKGSLEAAATPSPSDAPVSGTSTADGKEEEKGFFASHGALLGAVAGVCVVVGVIGYAVAMRRKNKHVQASKPPHRGQAAATFRASQSDRIDDPEPVAYISKKTTRNSTNLNSLPILGGAGTSSSSTDDMPMDVHKRGSEMEPSFDEMDSSYEEGTVTASNHVIPTQPLGARAPSQQQMQPSPPQQPPQQFAAKPPSRPSSADARGMAPSSLYDDRDTALYQGL